jgi:ketosteroid isomerase-like protein
MIDLYRRRINLSKPGAVVIGLIVVILAMESSMAETDLSAVVEAREIAFAKTMADRDLEAFLTFVAPEAIFFNGNAALRGKAAVKAAWAGFYEGEQAPFSWHPDTVEALDSGQLAISSGPVHSPTGEVVGRFNSIWRKEADGEWRVVFDKGS